MSKEKDNNDQSADHLITFGGVITYYQDVSYKGETGGELILKGNKGMVYKFCGHDTDIKIPWRRLVSYQIKSPPKAPLLRITTNSDNKYVFEMKDHDDLQQIKQDIDHYLQKQQQHGSSTAATTTTTPEAAGSNTTHQSQQKVKDETAEQTPAGAIKNYADDNPADHGGGSVPVVKKKYNHGYSTANTANNRVTDLEAARPPKQQQQQHEPEQQPDLTAPPPLEWKRLSFLILLLVTMAFWTVPIFGCNALTQNYYIPASYYQRVSSNHPIHRLRNQTSGVYFDRLELDGKVYGCIRRIDDGELPIAEVLAKIFGTLGFCLHLLVTILALVVELFVADANNNTPCGSSSFGGGLCSWWRMIQALIGTSWLLSCFIFAGLGVCDNDGSGWGGGVKAQCQIGPGLIVGMINSFLLFGLTITSSCILSPPNNPIFMRWRPSPSPS